ncbi:MAG: metallophosphoesterase [Firmicutes bacterium]|nr:metallophosphoesterase [Bacillota bacterium]
MDRHQIILSEQEITILEDIIAAASDFSDKYRQTSDRFIILDDKKVRFISPAFDLFRLVENKNIKAITKITGIEGLTVIKDYRLSNINALYNTDDIFQLYYRLQGFLKESTAENRKNPRILYIADCHFFHDRMCREMDKRGFANYEEMNEYMISQWNNKVTNRDSVYILGDFSISKSDATEKVLKRLNGKHHLIVGNHDRYIDDKDFPTNLFRSIGYYREIHDNGRKVILSHYPIFCYKGQYRRNKNGNPLTYMLYGHVHNTHDERLINRFITETRETRVLSKFSTELENIPCNMINCFCMFSGYQPMTLDEWIKIDDERRRNMED